MNAPPRRIIPIYPRSISPQYVKFSPSIQKDENLSHFIQKAINDLNGKINLYDYDLVIYPESSSRVNQYMLRYIYRFAQPTLRKYEAVLQTTTDEHRELCTTIRNQNILVIDDITTSGSTLNEILRTHLPKLPLLEHVGRQLHPHGPIP